jgi:hypothetical protein
MKLREYFNKKNHYRKAEAANPPRDCLSCSASMSDPGKRYDTLHCINIPFGDNTVDEDSICDLWNS